jgi:hypothetical protein
MKVFLTIFVWWWKDPEPEPDPYLVLMDPDPGGPKISDTCRDGIKVFLSFSQKFILMFWWNYSRGKKFAKPRKYWPSQWVYKKSQECYRSIIFAKTEIHFFISTQIRYGFAMYSISNLLLITFVTGVRLLRRMSEQVRKLQRLALLLPRLRSAHSCRVNWR